MRTARAGVENRGAPSARLRPEKPCPLPIYQPLFLRLSRGGVVLVAQLDRVSDYGSGC